MFKVGILGIDNSHAWNFSSVFAPKGSEKLYPDIELVGVYGEYSTEGGQTGMAKIKELSTCTRFVDHYNDLLDEVDAIMVTARDGADHLKFAEEYIKKGMIVWIDKPYTRDIAEAHKLVDLAKEYGAILTGGSSLPLCPDVLDLMAEVSEKTKEAAISGGHVTAPINMVNPFGNFWFYSQHLVQMMTRTFGNKVKAVQALRDNFGVHALYHYENYLVSAYFGTDYSISVHFDDGGLRSRRIKLFGHDEPYYMPEVRAFCEVLKSGKSNLTDVDILAPVYIIDATIKAYTENRIVEVSIPR